MVLYDNVFSPMLHQRTLRYCAWLLHQISGGDAELHQICPTKLSTSDSYKFWNYVIMMRIWVAMLDNPLCWFLNEPLKFD